MMNLTQKTIVLAGSSTNLSKATEVIKGFKAITLVRNLNPDIVANVYRHNKNVCYATDDYHFSLVTKYNPIVVKITSGETDFQRLVLGTDNVLKDFPILMDKLNIDVGDHQSQDSAGIRQNTCDCMVCRIVNCTPLRPEHILYESDNFFVIPGLGAFFEGYVMVCPKRHIMSFAECTKGEFEEFLGVLEDIKFILSSIYKKDIFVFECGSGRNGGGKHATSIVHAHIHLAPTDMPVLASVHKSGIHPGLISPNDLGKYGEYPYMLYIDQSNNWFITSDPDSYFPRQHPRQVLADYMGLEKGKYNWRIYKHEDMLDTIAAEWYKFITDNFDMLPVWMRSNVKKSD